MLIAYTINFIFLNFNLHYNFFTYYKKLNYNGKFIFLTKYTFKK